MFHEIFQSPEWLLLDKGVLSQEEVVELLTIRHRDDALEIKDIFQNWLEMLKPISGTVALLKQLRDSGYYNLYALSNYHILAFEKVYKENDFFQYFDGMIISALEKTIKPEREIYQKLITRYEIIPEEAIFIDDTEANLKGAEEFGMKTILFKSPHELKEKLRDYTIKF